MTVYINHDRFSTTLYDKRDSFSFDIVNFPHMSSNIPSKPAYGVYISQLIRIGRICEDFSAFAERHYKLTSRLIKQGFWYNKLCSAFKKFSLNHMDIFSKYKVSLREHFMKASVYHLWLRIHSLGIFIVDIHDNCTM